MRLRTLVIVLAVQVVLGAVLLWLIASGTLADWLTDDEGGGSTAAAPAVVATRPARVDRFDGPAAYAWAKRIVALGPRPAGSPTSRRVAALVRPALAGGRSDTVPARPRHGLRSLSRRRPPPPRRPPRAPPPPRQSCPPPTTTRHRSRTTWAPTPPRRRWAPSSSWR